MLFDKRLLISLLLLAACNSEQTPADAGEVKDTPVTKTEPADKNDKDSALIPFTGQEKPYAGQYCYITKLYTKTGTQYIEADYIQFLMGEEGLAAAKKRNDAIAEVNKKGDTVYSLPDNVYIVNDNTSLRTLPLAADVEFLKIEFVEGKPFYKKTPLGEMKTSAKDAEMYILTLNSSNVVTHIRQQYLP